MLDSFVNISESREYLTSMAPEIDSSLGGGLPFGSLVEWGMPLGLEGRFVLLSFIKRLTDGAALCLWVNGHKGLSVFPPAWFARGIDPRRLVFVNSETPLSELRAVLLSPLFKLVIIDSPKVCSKADCLFLSRQARKYGQIIMVVRNHFLTNRLGNVAAAMRVNCGRSRRGELEIRVIKG